MISRRDFVAQAVGLVAGLTAAGACSPGPARRARTAITVYKSATCGCCAKWVDHLRENGFAPASTTKSGWTPSRTRWACPRRCARCHTALLDRYLVEGHVPAGDLRRLLASGPRSPDSRCRACRRHARDGGPRTAAGAVRRGVVRPDGKTTLFAKH